MRAQLLSALVAFLLGLSVGGLAFGQKPGSNHAASNASTAASDERPTTVEGLRATAKATPEDQLVATAEKVKPAQVEGHTNTAITLGAMSELEALQVLNARWVDLEEQVRKLTQRFEGLERRVSEASTGANSEQEPAVGIVPSSESRRRALVAAGVSEAKAQEVIWRQSEQDLARLELRDQAEREGWFRSERYFEELQVLNDQGLDLREEIGELAYDNYLYQTGADNRVAVTSVIPGSAAELSGLQPGDIIESYAGNGIYNVRDLRSATTGGARGEQVPVTIRRGDDLIDTWVTRGPVGVTLESNSIAPDG